MYITYRYAPKLNNLTFENIFDNFTNPILPTQHSPKFFRTFTKVWPKKAKQSDLQQLLTRYNVPHMHTQLERLTPRISELLTEDMSPLYNTFYIPKHTGGFRRIDAPNPELMSLLYDIKTIFEHILKLLPHDTAYAYVPGRSTLDALTQHQYNQSKWFLKLDIKDFFPSCNQQFILKQFLQLFPFAPLMTNPQTTEIIINIIKIASLNNGLPQGTPLSPLLTNTIMLPIDFQIQEKLRNFDRHHFVYTRYADDLLISCRHHFNINNVQHEINKIFTKTHAPFTINQAKTRYGSSAGRNWNLGLMLNKENQITVGYKRKQRLHAAVFNFLKDLTAGTIWSKLDVQILIGTIAYYQKIEPEYVHNLINKYSTKFNVNFHAETQHILKS